MSDFELLFVDRVIVRGTLNLYHLNDALQLIDICEKKKVRILGIDSFIITETATIPQLEHSIDFSIYGATYMQVRDFLKSKKDLGLVFEIVFDA